MNKLFTIAALVLLNISAFAQMTEIRGKVPNPTINRVVYLFQIEDGETKLIKSGTSASDGSFVLTFDPAYEGFYMLGGFTAQAGQFPLYLKKGDKAEVTIDRSKMEFIGKQTDENEILSTWSKLTVKDRTAAFQKSVHTKNEKFNILMKQFVQFELDFYALNTARQNAASKENLPEYGKILLVKDKFKNDDVFAYPKGKALICMYADFAANLNKAADGLSYLSTDRQKGIYIFDRLKPNLKSYAQFEDMTNKYGRYLTHPILKAKVDALGAKLYNSTPGRKGANFSFPDQDGKMVSLSDFKGKVVLVDVWATYCGPCKALIPALNQLEAELHDRKDLVFIGVAQDGPRAKDTWLKIIKELQMGGIQLFAGGGKNVLANDYKIKVMPRYLIFDRLGNVVTAEAPLPSSPELKKMLLEALNKS
ncbi:TlpA family protein disulfide reductase [Pedobacter nyackensis]|uniref:Thiol-disulfide isomerase or thioredoxin n=1 Tax=Pedobacter nyackensis TaxID=475255 RepID=A0A1W2CR34_9SPHI|nr:TlpA disulfide reductase family protein [Pedobacter nyackensis]SMC87414.1 Thiol-disulfide isomerase or thioredoxin [Pedobacter nyackensis]